MLLVAHPSRSCEVPFEAQWRGGVGRGLELRPLATTSRLFLTVASKWEASGKCPCSGP